MLRKCCLNIFSQRPGTSLSGVNAIFCRQLQSAVFNIAPFAKFLLRIYGNSIFFRGFPLVIPYIKSCPKKLPTRHRRGWGYSAGTSELLGRRMCKKTSSSTGTIDCTLKWFRWFRWPCHFSIIWKNCITDVQCNLLYFLYFRWSQPCCRIAEITLQSLWPVEHLKDFWKDQKVYYCSGDFQIVTSRRNRFLTVLFIDSDISVAPILIAWRSLLLSQINHLNKPRI